MNRQPLIRTLTLVLLPLLSIVLATHAREQSVASPVQHNTQTIPVIDLRTTGHQPVTVPAPNGVSDSQSNRGGGSDPASPYAAIAKTGPTFAQPGSTIQMDITLGNYESVTHTVQLTDTLPASLTYLPNPDDGLTYNRTTRTLHWQGMLPPGHLDYLIEPGSLSLPYLDLAAFGVGNLCDDFVSCDDAAVTFNLGINGDSITLYGEPFSQLTVSANGLVLASHTAVSNPYQDNRRLPDTAVPGVVLAGLWRDTEAAGYGRFHAAIVSGLIEDHDVFYAQWHNIPQAGAPNLTARHAIAIVLDGSGTLDGHIFFIYDNISSQAGLAAQGYTIGIADKPGIRGTTYAFAPCCGSSQPPQGYPPPAATTLHLRPVLFGAENAYSRTFRYEAVVTGTTPETIASTVTATSSSSDPGLASVWATHYLHIRWQTFLPLVQTAGVTP